MKPNDITLSATELGEVLNLTARRVRQFAEEGIFPRAERGKYPLAACVQAYLAECESRGDSDELRRERIRLTKAQARRLEIDNARSEGETTALDYQEVCLSVFATHLFLRLRPTADWLHALMLELGHTQDATLVAGEVQNWLIGARSEIETEMRTALQHSRNRGYVVQGYDDLMRLLGRDPTPETEESED